jgi:hypothetical protein
MDKKLLTCITFSTALSAEDAALAVEGLLAYAEDAQTINTDGVLSAFEDFAPGFTPVDELERGDFADDLCRCLCTGFRKADAAAIADDSDESEAPGVCSLCTRFMPQTKHHVVPRMTHKRYITLQCFAQLMPVHAQPCVNECCFVR